mmetsp:Transcript_960/g.3152  ORF Transcript_960/g.3152 Transcript_960/m.3152 type:complete len:201 (+) Transcript_960:615-1217(+)
MFSLRLGNCTAPLRRRCHRKPARSSRRAGTVRFRRQFPNGWQSPPSECLFYYHLLPRLRRSTPKPISRQAKHTAVFGQARGSKQSKARPGTRRVTSSFPGKSLRRGRSRRARCAFGRRTTPSRGGNRNGCPQANSCCSTTPPFRPRLAGSRESPSSCSARNFCPGTPPECDVANAFGNSPGAHLREARLLRRTGLFRQSG